MSFEVNDTIISKTTGAKYTIIYKSLDIMTIVADYINATPMSLPIDFVTSRYEGVKS